MNLLPTPAIEAMEKVFKLQRENELRMIEAFYGSKPFWVKHIDGELVVTPIEPEEFYQTQATEPPASHALAPE